MSRNIFNSVPVSKPKRSHFDLSHSHLTTGDMGNLIPMCYINCLPGDSFRIAGRTQLTFAPMIAPNMTPVNLYMHYWFVPYRLLWANWEKYITHDNSTTDLPVMPNFSYGQTGDIPSDGTYRLADYFGLPEMTTNLSNQFLCALYPAAYQKIWNDYYRDQNLQADINPPGTYLLVDGTQASSDAANLFRLRKRAWMHDQFTAALPFVQKGVEVALPVDVGDLKVFANDASSLYTTLSGSPANIAIPGTPSQNSNVGAGGLFAMGGAATNTVINDLRTAIATQQFLEKNARGGTRYSEMIREHFAITPQDARLQRAEYIGGSKSPVIVSEVLNTSGSFDPTDPTAPSSPPQGNMSGHGKSYNMGKYSNYFCQEHGVILGLMSVMPVTAYMQGLHKFWKLEDHIEDFAWPTFANLGEQLVSTDEVYLDFDHGANPDKVDFGYNPRYYAYKYMPSIVTGNFKSNLDFWTLGRKFNAIPQLNEQFIECDASKRIFAVQDPEVDSLYIQHYNEVHVKRALPKYGSPGLIRL